jgi:hypothetical protein
MALTARGRCLAGNQTEPFAVGYTLQRSQLPLGKSGVSQSFFQLRCRQHGFQFETREPVRARFSEELLQTRLRHFTMIGHQQYPGGCQVIL